MNLCAQCHTYIWEKESEKRRTLTKNRNQTSIFPVGYCLNPNIHVKIESDWKIEQKQQHTTRENSKRQRDEEEKKLSELSFWCTWVHSLCGARHSDGFNSRNFSLLVLCSIVPTVGTHTRTLTLTISILSTKVIHGEMQWVRNYAFCIFYACYAARWYTSIPMQNTL